MPAFRAYDLGCEFDASHVQQMYGADMRIRVRDHDGRPALAADGSELVLDNAWEEAPATTLTTGEATWLSRLDACTGDVEWTSLAADEELRAAVPGLLYDDFSGALATAWTAHVLDPAETRAAGWHLSGGTLVQDVEIDGGTAYVAADVDVADVAVETVGWADSGSFGLVFRWQGTGDLYRFSITPERQRLVRVTGGTARELWSAPGGYAPGVPTLLAVQAEGGRIRCQVGERLVCDVVDADRGRGRERGPVLVQQRQHRVRRAARAASGRAPRWRPSARTPRSWKPAGRCSRTRSRISRRSIRSCCRRVRRRPAAARPAASRRSSARRPATRRSRRWRATRR